MPLSLSTLTTDARLGCCETEHPFFPGPLVVACHHLVTKKRWIEVERAGGTLGKTSDSGIACASKMSFQKQIIFCERFKVS